MFSRCQCMWCSFNDAALCERDLIRMKMKTTTDLLLWESKRLGHPFFFSAFLTFHPFMLYNSFLCSFVLFFVCLLFLLKQGRKPFQEREWFVKATARQPAAKVKPFAAVAVSYFLLLTAGGSIFCLCSPFATTNFSRLGQHPPYLK